MRFLNRAKLLWSYLRRRERVPALPVEYIVETTAKDAVFDALIKGAACRKGAKFDRVRANVVRFATLKDQKKARR